MLTLRLLLLLLAAMCFAAATISTPSRVNLTPLGLFLVTVAQLLL